MRVLKESTTYSKKTNLSNGFNRYNYFNSEASNKLNTSSPSDHKQLLEEIASVQSFGSHYGEFDKGIDPVSFVDDLNVFSFLDYLREIVINENRQIFFATANQKPASFFDKKFSFLEANE